VQLAAEGRSTRAMCTTLAYTDDEQLVLTLEDTAEQVVLVRRGRYELPLIEARVGRHTEVTLAAPDGGRIMLQLEERKRPRHPEGDGAAAAC
jgi:predicted  nucleic acid-binding Zn-ribbon protein